MDQLDLPTIMISMNLGAVVVAILNRRRVPVILSDVVGFVVALGAFFIFSKIDPNMDPLFPLVFAGAIITMAVAYQLFWK